MVEASGFNIMDKQFEEVKGKFMNLSPRSTEFCLTDQVLAEDPISNPGAFPIGPIFACLYNYFSFLCNFVLLETICVKLAMDMWGWTESEAIANMGWTMMGAGGCTLVVFCLIGPLSKRFHIFLHLRTPLAKNIVLDRSQTKTFSKSWDPEGRSLYHVKP